MATRNRIRASLAPECVTDDVVVMVMVVFVVVVLFLFRFIFRCVYASL